MEILGGLFGLLTIFFFADSRIWRRKAGRLKAALKEKPKSEWEKRAETAEINYLIEAMRMEGIENLLAAGWTLRYSHSVGICAKPSEEADCIPLDNAIFEVLYAEDKSL